LNSWISAVGFHNKKAKYIKDATTMISEKFNGIVPSNFEDITSLPGVGPKMAHLLLQICYGKVEGIAVDTHVHRLANRLHWVRKSTSTPD
jgi:endonuclease-3